MKIKRSICLACALAIVAVVLLVFFAKRPVETLKQDNPSGVVTEPGKPNPKTASLADTNVPSPTSSSNTSIRQSLWKMTAEQMREGLAAFNDAPIVFYGKVEDQFGAPLANTPVTFSIQVYNGVESGIKNGEVATDANGFFTISGYKGERLSVKPQKAGYVIASLICGGIYSTMYPEEQRAHPDPNNPVVIKMWKLQGAEPLVSFDKTYKLHYTNVIDIDFISGEIVSSGGDIKIKVNRPSGEVSEHNPQDWSFRIESVEGGLIEKSGKEEAVTFVAPEEGYEQNQTFIFSTKPSYKWFDGFTYGFFVKSRNGQVYSKIGLSFSINSKPDDLMYIRFSGVANTNGSRNWEATAPK